ncbi:hypothetical protein KQI65_17300 [bacterium]|nr:hypothetical protein [bacterium]
MRHIAMTALLLVMFMSGCAHAQQEEPQVVQPQRFDPAVFLGSVHINQRFGHGNVRVPGNMHMEMVDSLFTGSSCIGFSMRLSPDSGDGWTMWLDYDVDRYYRPFLMRVFAQRPVGENESDAFPEYRDFVAKVQKSNLGEMKEKGENEVAWQWMRRTAYELSIQRVQKEGGQWLTLSLAPMSP